MTIPGILLSFALTALVLLIVSAPFWRKRAAIGADAAAELQRERVLAYYERVLRNVRDLDEDFALGKLVEADYRRDRELWTERGVQALKLLDTLDAGGQALTAASGAAELDAAVERAVQAAVARVRAAQGEG